MAEIKYCGYVWEVERCTLEEFIEANKKEPFYKNLTEDYFDGDYPHASFDVIILGNKDSLFVIDVARPYTISYYLGKLKHDTQETL